jgi:hypothetical protein
VRISRVRSTAGSPSIHNYYARAGAPRSGVVRGSEATPLTCRYSLGFKSRWVLSVRRSSLSVHESAARVATLHQA